MARRLVYGLFCSVQSPETGCKGMKKFSNLARKKFSFLLCRFSDEFGLAKIDYNFIRNQEEFLLFFSFSMSQNGAAKLIRLFNSQKVSKLFFFGL